MVVHLLVKEKLDVLRYASPLTASFFFKGMRPRRYLNRHSYGGASARQGGAWNSQGRGGRAASAQFTCFYQYKSTLTDAFGGRQRRVPASCLCATSRD